MLELTKDVPIPSVAISRRTTSNPYPFASMEVGHSFAVPLPSRAEPNRTNAEYRVRVAASRAGRRYSARFACSVTGDEARVWRVR